jgi:hypothetical protein
MLVIASLFVLAPILLIGVLVFAACPKLWFSRSPETPFRPRLNHFMGLIVPLIGVGFFLEISTSGHGPWEAALAMVFDVAFVLAVYGLGLGRRLSPFVWLARASLVTILFSVLMAITLLQDHLYR